MPTTDCVQADTVRNWSDITTTLVDQNVSPREFQLEHNYPNPFNPSTVIRYSLPHGEDVILTVYNTQGQQVATLVHGHQEAGYHAVPFNANKLAGGVYFYRWKAGHFEAMKRVMLLH